MGRCGYLCGETAGGLEGGGGRADPDGAPLGAAPPANCHTLAVTQLPGVSNAIGLDAKRLGAALGIERSIHEETRAQPKQRPQSEMLLLESL